MANCGVELYEFIFFNESNHAIIQQNHVFQVRNGCAHNVQTTCNRIDSQTLTHTRIRTCCARLDTSAYISDFEKKKMRKLIQSNANKLTCGAVDMDVMSMGSLA